MILNKDGIFYIQTEVDPRDAAAFRRRIDAILNLIQERSPDFKDDTETIHHALDVVNEMIPTTEQYEKFFSLKTKERCLTYNTPYTW